MVFTPEQKAFCVAEWIKEASPKTVQRKFRTHFRLGGRAKVPIRSRIQEWHEKFMRTASANRKKRTNPRILLTPQKTQQVVANFVANPHLSTRNLALREEMPSRTSVQRVMKEAKWHPYKLQLRHQIDPRNNDNEGTRIVHAYTQLAIMEEDQSFLGKLMFLDEAHFHVNGVVNRQDFRYWSHHNPQWYAEQPLHLPRVTVCAAIGKQGIVGPFFFDANVNGTNYLAMLQEQVVATMAVTLQNFDEIVFMQDGAPPH